MYYPGLATATAGVFLGRRSLAMYPGMVPVGMAIGGAAGYEAMAWGTDTPEGFSPMRAGTAVGAGIGGVRGLRAATSMIMAEAPTQMAPDLRSFSGRSMKSSVRSLLQYHRGMETPAAMEVSRLVTGMAEPEIAALSKKAAKVFAKGTVYGAAAGLATGAVIKGLGRLGTQAVEVRKMGSMQTSSSLPI